MPQNPRVAVLIPCYNEAVAIAKVVMDFRASLPDALIYVYDNNSDDHTAEAAEAAGASSMPKTSRVPTVRNDTTTVRAIISSMMAW